MALAVAVELACALPARENSSRHAAVASYQHRQWQPLHRVVEHCYTAARSDTDGNTSGSRQCMMHCGAKQPAQSWRETPKGTRERWIGWSSHPAMCVSPACSQFCTHHCCAAHLLLQPLQWPPLLPDRCQMMKTGQSSQQHLSLTSEHHRLTAVRQQQQSQQHAISARAQRCSAMPCL
jgi:hypothetical protein